MKQNISVTGGTDKTGLETVMKSPENGKLKKKLEVKRAAWASLMVYLIGISAFIGSHYLPLLPDPEVQANWVLSIALIPAAVLGAHFYYRNRSQTNGWILGLAMFIGAMVLDAIITVPLFIMPGGGNHRTFFTDPGFWLIAVEYVTVVAMYSILRKTNKPISLIQV